ncbi:MAG: leucine-rich repeat domain-containing protein, partial [Oscillospiraceae bacterium]|nr:leucine-rich repeat domain-containing protein [Oscillospiraceae bacterium]
MKFEIEHHVLTKCIAESDEIIAVVPDSVTNIGDDAFYNCEFLQEIHLPDSITSIGDWAFVNCKSLQEI